MEEIINNNDDEQKDNDQNEDKDFEEYEKICYLCHRPESKAGKMIELPQNIYICADCMQKTFDSMNGPGGYDDLMKMSGMPGIHFMNLSDFGDMPERQKIKKRKKGDNQIPPIDLKSVPAPHEIKAMPRRLFPLPFTIIIRELPRIQWIPSRFRSPICL